ncbi:MAG TPA: IS481 family transposase [Ramlibacter sp.]|nr:IS481 family transposase [Ramlibacter sp.]
MVWTEKSVVEQRLEFVMLASMQGANVSRLCERFGISRKTGYKWLGRFKQQEPEGSLDDASRRPRTSPQRCDAALEAQVVGLRTEHPAWGGRKIAHVLEREHGAHLAASTVTSILRRHQLIDRRASEAATPWQRFEHVAPNNLWQMDFKGHFALARGRCHPLTVLDDHSRYNIVLQACSNEQGATVQAALREVFRRYGLPTRINTDNGQPWGDAGQHLTRLGAWLVRLGIRVSHSTPMHPQTNGKDERFHRTLKAEVLRGRSFADIEQCQQAFERWRAVYNTRRPHEALQMKTPVQRYQPSNLSYPEVLPDIEYAPSDKVRRVDKAGRISIVGASVFISNALHGMPVGLRQSIEDADGLDVFFCHQRIKTLWLSELH